MAIALIIVLLCVMLVVMVYVLASLVKFVVLLGVRHKNEVDLLNESHHANKIKLLKTFDDEKKELRIQLTSDFLMKAELMEMHKDPKIAIPLRKINVVQIPVENDFLMGYDNFVRPDAVMSFQMKTMKNREIHGDYKMEPFVLRNIRFREQLKDALAKEVAKYLIKHDLIESAIDERNMMINFRMNILE